MKENIRVASGQDLCYLLSLLLDLDHLVVCVKLFPFCSQKNQIKFITERIGPEIPLLTCRAFSSKQIDLILEENAMVLLFGLWLPGDDCLFLDMVCVLLCCLSQVRIIHWSVFCSFFIIVGFLFFLFLLLF